MGSVSFVRKLLKGEIRLTFTFSFSSFCWGEKNSLKKNIKFWPTKIFPIMLFWIAFPDGRSGVC